MRRYNAGFSGQRKQRRRRSSLRKSAEGVGSAIVNRLESWNEITVVPIGGPSLRDRRHSPFGLRITAQLFLMNARRLLNKPVLRPSYGLLIQYIDACPMPMY